MAETPKFWDYFLTNQAVDALDAAQPSGFALGLFSQMHRDGGWTLGSPDVPADRSKGTHRTAEEPQQATTQAIETASFEVSIATDGTAHTVIDLTGLAPAEGFIIQGDETYDVAGSSVSGAGDVNGDGYADLIVGAPHGDDGGSNAGEAYVIFGKASGFGTVDLSGLAPTEGFIIQGDAFGGLVGRSVSDAGDVNGDGFADLIVSGAPSGAGAGSAYVVFGKASGFGTVDLAGLAPADGFIIHSDAPIDRAGWSVSGAADLNGDGFADLIVGAERGDDGGTNAGEAYVVFGKASGFGTVDLTGLAPADGFIIQGDAEYDRAGSSVSDAGDVNGDGFADLIVGARTNYNGSYVRTIQAYVIFGKASDFGTVDLTGLDPVDGFKIQGDTAFNLPIATVSGAGDVNGDGFDDMIIGVQFEGKAYVVFGKASGFGTVDLAELTPDDGFIIQSDASRDDTGRTVSGAGDVNGDGIDDLIIGANRGGSGGYIAGEAYVIFGKHSGFDTVDLGALAPADGFIIVGDVARDYAGYSVSSAGDVNGDGFADLIVGARHGGDGGFFAGEAYVIFGKASGFGSVDLTGLAPADGFIIQGDETRDLAGVSVSDAGDVNGDGFDDLIVGAFGGDDGGRYAGEAYVIFGKASGFGTVDLTGLAPEDGFIIQGDEVHDFAGRSVSGAGDVNGDGFADVIVGARYGDDGGYRAGEAYVIFGGNFAGAVTHLGTEGDDVLTGTAGDDNMIGGLGNDTLIGGAGDDRMAGADGDDVFVLSNGSGNDVVAGFQAGGDVINLTGFGFADFAALTAAMTQDRFGTTIQLSADDSVLLEDVKIADLDAGDFVLNLIDLSALDPARGFIIQGDEAYDHAGVSVSGAGDVNGDGFADLIVGAPRGDDGGSQAGEAYVVFGKASGFDTVDLTGLTPADGFIIRGGTALSPVNETADPFGDRVGWSVSGAGDVNGDGFDDLVVGAPFAYRGVPLVGEAYVIFGKAFGFGTIDLTDLAPDDGFIIQGNATGGFAGYSVSGAGDVNGDGFDDLIIGEPLSRDGGTRAGEAHVIFGKSSGFGTVDLTELTPVDGFSIQGDLIGDQAGWSVSGAGDVNGDGFTDLIIGAFLGDDGGFFAGEAYVIFGKASGFGTVDLTGLAPADGFIIQGDAAGDYAGYSVSGAGDVNGDGFADLIIGAHRNDDGGSLAGKAYVIFGKASGLGTVDLTGLAPADGFAIQGDTRYDYAGFSVSDAGDVNGDGLADVIIGAPGGDDGGKAYVIFGKASGFDTVDLTGLAPADGFVIQGDAAGDYAGISVSGAGDVNGDGFADLIVGARGGDDGGTSAGEAYVIFGGDFTGAVTHLGTEGNDSLIGTGGDDIMIGGLGDDFLAGTGGKDRIIGADGNDILNGGAGDDYLDGGGGVDTASYAASAGAVSVDLNLQGATQDTGTDSGLDTLIDIKNIIGSNFADTLVGNSQDNTLSGLAGNDILIGGLGADTLNGGTGADTMTGGGDSDSYVVDDAGDVIIELAAGGTADVVRSTLSYTLGNNVEQLRLLGSDNIDAIGNTGDNLLVGNSGNNRLNGAAGADTMQGGDGDDIYFVDNSGDVVIEGANLGTDQVQSSISITLASNIENGLLLTTVNLNLTGNALNNTLFGNAGNNVLNGGAGMDVMAGGGGNDTYFVDLPGDFVSENANEGTDMVLSTADFTLRPNIENLTLLGSANLQGIGNAENNLLIGNSGANRLNGSFGADIMIGGDGNDIYSVDDAGDLVIENAGGGVDTVLSFITQTLGANVERLYLFGTADIDATGNGEKNKLLGNDGDNVLSGEAGNDHLYGGLGNDTMSGGVGSDTFYFHTALDELNNVETLIDFSHTDDTMRLDSSVFTGLSTGLLSSSAFIIGTAAGDADHRIIYDDVTGDLFFDADGNGAGAQVQFATLDDVPTDVAFNDFLVI